MYLEIKFNNLSSKFFYFLFNQVLTDKQNCARYIPMDFLHAGKKLPRGKYPWAVAILCREDYSYSFKCGGTISKYIKLSLLCPFPNLQF